MGLGDAPKQINLTDIYPEGTPFLIERAWVEGIVQTQYGERTMGKVLVKAADGSGTAMEFAVWGSQCEQIQQADEGDVPGIYTVRKDGKRVLFAAVEGAELPAEADTLAAAEAAGEVPAAAPPAAAPAEGAEGVAPSA